MLQKRHSWLYATSQKSGFQKQPQMMQKQLRLDRKERKPEKMWQQL